METPQVITVDSIGALLAYIWGLRAHHQHAYPPASLRLALTNQVEGLAVAEGLSVQLTPKLAARLTNILCDAMARQAAGGRTFDPCSERGQ